MRAYVTFTDRSYTLVSSQATNLALTICTCARLPSPVHSEDAAVAGLRCCAATGGSAIGLHKGQLSVICTVGYTGRFHRCTDRSDMGEQPCLPCFSERQLTEIEALSHIFGEENVRGTIAAGGGALTHICQGSPGHPRVTVTAPIDASSGSPGSLQFDFQLPEGYPETQAPHATVSCTELQREQVRLLQAAVAKFLGEEWSGCCGTGEECLFDIIVNVQEAARTIAAASAVPSPPEPGAAGDAALTAEASLLRIDHMNDFQGYTASLSRWAKDLSIQAVLMLQNKAGQKRASDIAVYLQGHGEALKAFLKRLRTEYVDVNSRGQKCKERQFQVLCSREVPPPGSPSDTSGLTSAGLEICMYSSKEEMHARLQQLGVLPAWTAEPGT